MTAVNLLRCSAWAALAACLSAAPVLARDDGPRDRERADRAAEAAKAAHERAQSAQAARDSAERDEVRHSREPHPTGSARPAPVDMTVDPFNGGPPTPVANCYDSPRGCPAPTPKN